MAFDKIQHPYKINICNKPGINGNFLSPIKKITKYLIIFNSERLIIPHLRRETRQKCLLWPILLNTVLDILAKAIKQENEIRGIQTEEKEVADDIILYIENPNEFTISIWKLKNNFK